MLPLEGVVNGGPLLKTQLRRKLRLGTNGARVGIQQRVELALGRAELDYNELRATDQQAVAQTKHRTRRNSPVPRVGADKASAAARALGGDDKVNGRRGQPERAQTLAEAALLEVPLARYAVLGRRQRTGRCRPAGSVADQAQDVARGLMAHEGVHGAPPCNLAPSHLFVPITL